MIKCPNCGLEFDEKIQPKVKWYFTTYWVVIALLCVGPFGLPLVWYNPRYQSTTKWIVSIIVIIITVWLTIKSIETYKSLQHQLNGLNF